MELKPYNFPVKQMLYEMDFVKAEVSEMPEERVPRPSSSEWAYPVVLVPKEDGGLRFWVEYRPINAATARDSYRMPCMYIVSTLLVKQSASPH